MYIFWWIKIFSVFGNPLAKFNKTYLLLQMTLFLTSFVDYTIENAVMHHEEPMFV